MLANTESKVGSIATPSTWMKYFLLNVKWLFGSEI